MVLVYFPIWRLAGSAEIVRTDGVVLLLREADTQLAPSVVRVKARGVGLKTLYCAGAGTEPPI
jgi:hypothetical protein